MGTKVLRTFSKWLRTGAAVLFAIGVLLSGLGGMGHILRMQAKAPYPLLAIDGERRVHVLCEGPDDAPFVLYDAGAFGIYSDGWWVKEALKRDHRVCLYDRAGMGWSDPVPGNTSPSPDWHVEDMRRLRHALGAEAPFVLIGHSMAGLRLHAYANAYPEDLQGLVFIDAARPQTMNTDTASRFAPWLLRAMTVGIGLARIGLAGGVSYLLPDELDLPDQQSRDKRRSMASVRHHRATRAEVAAALAAWPGASWRTETGAERLPVSVFTNSPDGGANAPVADAARRTTGIGRITVLAEESHVSLLNAVNAEKIAADVRIMTGALETP